MQNKLFSLNVLVRFIVALVIPASACVAHAQGYPTRSIRYVVAQAPGGSSDTLARVLAPRLAAALGQQVVVDNRPGATGIIGAEITVNAPPDGLR
jgi:tripartite-type tricarboxylate transporter receptor subunit TctC